MAKIVRNPKILVGKPTIEGTRISVELILNLIENGQTIPEIMADYDLTEDQVKAAIRFANKRVEEDYPVQKAFAHEVFAGRKNVGKVVAKFLNNLGHSTLRVRQIDPGIEDFNVLNLAVSKNSVLITSDRDFGQLIFKENQGHCGVIYLRLKVSTSENKILAIKYLLENFASNLEGNFLVIKENEGQFRVRIR